MALSFISLRKIPGKRMVGPVVTICLPSLANGDPSSLHSHSGTEYYQPWGCNPPAHTSEWQGYRSMPQGLFTVPSTNLASQICLCIVWHEFVFTHLFLFLTNGLTMYSWLSFFFFLALVNLLRENNVLWKVLLLFGREDCNIEMKTY